METGPWSSAVKARAKSDWRMTVGGRREKGKREEKREEGGEEKKGGGRREEEKGRGRRGEEFRVDRQSKPIVEFAPQHRWKPEQSIPTRISLLAHGGLREECSSHAEQVRWTQHPNSTCVLRRWIPARHVARVPRAHSYRSERGIGAHVGDCRMDDRDSRARLLSVGDPDLPAPPHSDVPVRESDACRPKRAVPVYAQSDVRRRCDQLHRDRDCHE